MIKRQAEPEAGKISNSWGGQVSPGKGQTELIVKKIVLGKQETSSRFQIFVSISCQNKSSPECYIQFCHLLLLGPTLYLFMYHLLRASQVALVVKNPPANAGDLRDVGSIPVCRRSPEGNSNPLQYSCLQNPTDRRGWWARVHGVAKSQTRLKQLSTLTRGATESLSLPPPFSSPGLLSLFI